MVEDIAKKRIEYIDLAKGFCIIMVVLYHVAKFYDTTLLVNGLFKLIRMPLYFFLSGVFFKEYGGFLDFLKRKTNKLLIPFSFWYLLLSVCFPLVLYYLFGYVSDRMEDFSFLGLLTSFWTKEDFPDSAIWFLLCLFYVNLLFYLVYLLSSFFKSHKSLVIFVLSIIIGGIGMFLCFRKINLPAFLDSSLTSLPFFCFGYLVRNHTKILEPNKYDKHLLLISLVLFCLVGGIALLFREGYSLKYNMFTYKSALIAYPCGFLGTLAVILFSKKVNRLPIISVFGQYSIMILVTHKTILELYSILFRALGVADNIAIYLNLTITLLSYLLIIPFMKRFLPHVTAQKDVIKV